MKVSLSSLLLLIGLTAAAFAQSPLGTVAGVVTDPTSSIVPNAELTLENVDTHVVLKGASNGSGAYAFANLPPAKYKLTAVAKGFQKFETNPFDVAAFRNIRQDIRLQVSGTDTVTMDVVGESIQLDTPAINPSLSRRQLLELPTNLRSVYNNSGDSGLTSQILPLTIPGVQQVGAGAAWIVPGSGANGVKLKVDGIETNFGNFGTADPVSQPSMESVQEFTANIFTTRAEFGGMGTITSVTRSGTNGWHGDLFWYARNGAFDARNPILGAQFQNIHDYGLAAGGPIKKDKTFAFFTYDGIRGVRAYPIPPTAANVPTRAQRNGDFTGSAALRNPFSGVIPFNGNVILPQFISPQAKAAQAKFFPLPNFGPDSSFTGNYRASFTGPESHNIAEGRVDHYFAPGHSAFARYEYKKSDYHIPGARSTLPASSVGTSTNDRRVHFLAFGDVWAARPTIVNEFRAGVIDLESKSTADLLGQDVLNLLGITGLPDRTGIKGIPNIAITGYSTVTQSLLNPVNDGHWQMADNLTWVTGRHTLKFGGEYVYWFVNRHLTTNANLFGNYGFTNRYTGNAYADFLLGLPTTVGRLDPFPVQYNRFYDWSMYAQDDFKVTSRLTLSYGIRYEFNAPVTARNGNLYSFDLASGSVVVPDGAQKLFSPYFPASLPVKTASQVGLGSSLRNADKNNFAPRFGFSYGIGSNAKTVVRGGWGIYYGHFSGDIAGYLAAGPYASTTTYTNPASGPVFNFANAFQQTAPSGSFTLNGVSPNLSAMYAMQYSLTVEREIGRNYGLRVSYLGSKGTNIPYQRNVNQPLPSTLAFAQARRPYPLFNNISYADNGANSRYSALQVQMTKRMSNGLSFQSAWTWAKSLSEVDDNGDAEVNTLIENAYDRRRDRADVYSVPRHSWMNQALYELPWAQKKLWGGWQLNMLLNLSTGNFLNPQFSGSDPSGTNTVGGRPDVVSAITYPQTLAAWFDRLAFAVPATGSGRFGNAARNSIVGPGFVLFNAGVVKSFYLEKAGRIQLGASFQNAINHFNYGQPSTTVNVATGGSITSTHIFPPAGSARTGLLSFRWTY